MLTYKIRHYRFQVFTDKLVPIRKNTLSLPFNSLLIYSKKYWRPDIFNSVLFCAISEYCWKENSHAYTLKLAIKRLTHAFLHFVASLQRRFYTLGPISVLYVNI